MRVLCPDDATLHAFLSGQLRNDELTTVDTHIDSCADCREVVVLFARGSDPHDGTDGNPDVAPDIAVDGTIDGTIDIATDVTADVTENDRRARLAATQALDDSYSLDDTGMAATAPGHGDDSAVQTNRRVRVRSSLERGRSVGRYLILDTLGQGAMGVVYAAYDPDLHRRVALKLVRPNAVAGTRERMLREARAMARLAHVNVVTIYEVGTLDNAVYLAMELIEGETLRAWMASEPRTWREVRAIFAQIGAGLAAAHEAGVIHRDVKPDNVIIGADGRARVTDFGLARAEADSELVDTAANTLENVATPAGASALQLTRTGTLLGTPAYMAPEQFARAPADARTDQFGMCVALYEALYGMRPFSGNTLASLEAAVTAGDIAAPPADASVPSWLHDVVIRGMSIDPADRYPSLTELLADLEYQPRRPWWRTPSVLASLALLVAVAVVTVVGGLWWSERAQPETSVCTGAPAAIEPAWNDQRAQTIAAAFAHTGAPYAATGAQAAIQELTSWRQRWVAMHEQTCRATRVLGQQSERLLDIRMRCLDRKLGEFDALVDQLEAADQRTVKRTDSALAALADIAECGHIETLSSLPPEPAEPQARARLRALEERLATAKALIATGDYRAADSLVAAQSQAARALGYQPAIADTELVRADALRSLGQLESADAAAQQAIEAAVQADHEWAAARAWIVRVGIAGARGDYERAREHAGVAAASVAHLGSPAELAAKAASSRGVVLYNLGAHAEASTLLERALALRVKHLGAHHPEVARTLTNLGNVARADGDLDKAREYHERALAIDRAALGEQHPHIGRHLHNLARIDRVQGRAESALTRYRRALAIKSAALGEDHYEVGLTHNSLGLLFYEDGELASAEPHYRAALRIFTATDAAESALCAYNLGLVLIESGRPAEAVELLTRARDEYRASLGADSERLAEVENALARARTRVRRARRQPQTLRELVTGERDSPEPPPARGTYGAGQAWDRP